MTHYLIIGLLVVGVVIWQLSFFLKNREKIFLFRYIFPNSKSQFQLVKDASTNFAAGIKTQHVNSIMEIIVSSINSYLTSNKGAVSDYHLMKDIVDRNSDAIEEEIHTQIPVPLYLGLAGTMLGILTGVSFLVFSGGLSDLLNSGDGASAKGVEALLSGVALAMISSIVGIGLTTWGSHIAKDAKKEVEKNKNTFLSWMQSELLPNLSNDTSGALVRMTHNLLSFNETFAQNTQDLRTTLSKVNDSYEKQIELIQVVNKLKIVDIATANIQVYDKLKNSTNEIGVFAQYLQNTNAYLANIQALNKKLDDYERRTQVIENAGNFFMKNEKWLAENFDTANLEVKGALNRFIEGMSDSLKKMQESLDEQILNFNSLIQRQQETFQKGLNQTTDIVFETFIKTQETFDKAISDQQRVLQSKLHEISILVEEIRNLKHIKDGIKEFKEAINSQNAKIEELTKEIRALAVSTKGGGTIYHEIRLSKRMRLFAIIGCSIVVVACLFYIILIFT